MKPASRFPKSYVMYETGQIINFSPDDPRIRKRDGYLEILGVPRRPKLGLDSKAGWFAYLMPNDLMFVKRFPTWNQRVYNEAAGLTISIWYPEGQRVELEPIGPRFQLDPGEFETFTEDWYLFPRRFSRRQTVDLPELKKLVDHNTTRFLTPD